MLTQMSVSKSNINNWNKKMQLGKELCTNKHKNINKRNKHE